MMSARFLPVGLDHGSIRIVDITILNPTMLPKWQIKILVILIVEFVSSCLVEKKCMSSIIYWKNRPEVKVIELISSDPNLSGHQILSRQSSRAELVYPVFLSLW